VACHVICEAHVWFGVGGYIYDVVVNESSVVRCQSVDR
jgi:hypothetical protein